MPIALILSLIVFQALLIFVHLALYEVLAAAFGIGSPALATIFVLLAVSFIAASFLSRWFAGRLAKWFYTASAYWFGLVHFLFAGAVIFFFTAKFLYGADIYVAPWIIALPALGAFFLIHLYGTWNSWRAEVTRVRVTLPNLPAAWRGKKIVFVSDIHLGPVRAERFAAKVVRKIQALAPEAIFIGGDVYDGGKWDAATIAAPLKGLHAPQGVYYVTGNHEYYVSDLPAALKVLRDAGIRILDNEKIDLGGLQLLGVDYQTTHKPADAERILAGMGIDRNKPSILLKHEPDHLDIPEHAGVSLVLSGHTHRGQIFPLNYFTWQIYKGFDYGLKSLRAMQVYTSSGVGTWGPPLRLGTKSEIVLVELS